MARVQQVCSFNELPACLSVWPGLGQALGISRSTAYQMIRQPGFPAVRISDRKVVVPKDKLLQFIEEKADSGLKN